MSESTTELIIEGEISTPEPTFAQKLTESLVSRPGPVQNLGNNQNKNPITVDFVLPFTKEIFENEAKQEELFAEAVSNIRKGLPRECRNNLTILKTTIPKKDGKKLRAVRVLAPQSIYNEVQALKLNGINIRDKHIVAWGPKERVIDAYPKEVNMYFRNLAHFFDDEDVLQAVKLPDMMKQTTMIQKETIATNDEDGGCVYTGRASCRMLIEDEKQEELLSSWAETSCVQTFELFGTQFFCNIPSLLICEHCEKAGRRAKGHHVSYCYQKFRSSKNNQKEPSDQRLMKSKESEYHEKKPKQSEKEVSQEVQSDGEISYDTNTNFSQVVKRNVNRRAYELRKQKLPQTETKPNNYSNENETQFESLGTITRSRIRQKTVKSSDEKGLNSESELSKEVNESPNLELLRA